MSVRALIAALIVLASSSVAADVVPTRKPWHSVIRSPLAGLPVVTIDLGYPGPYIPTLNAPITIHATATDVSFDGYIGFHFAVRDRRTVDTPVIARARLHPHESWSFTTMATQRRCCVQNIALPREIAIEWRNSAMHLVAARAAGVPPWTSWNDDLLPLRVVSSGAQMAAPKVLGSQPYLERAESLVDHAQWYAGFSAVVIPLATWLDLPARIREAIFGSGVPVAFFGFPRPDQRLSHLDQTLLPVAFSARPGSYDAPWPYRASRPMPVATPLSWTAKKDSDRIGSDQNPYLARTNAAAWGADEVAVMRPLPAMARIGNSRWMSFDELELEAGDWPDETRRHFLSMVSKRNFLSVYSGAAATIAAIVLASAAWMLLRRTPRTVVAVAVVLVVAVAFAQRSRVRPPAGVRHYMIRAPIAPGIVDQLHVSRTYGPAPLAGVVHDAGLARTSMTGDYGKGENAEVRGSDTPPSMGLLIQNGYWDAVSRWSYRRELDSSSVASVANRPAIRVVNDYHSPIGFWLVERQSSNSGPSRMDGRLKTQSDGRATATFALPSNVQRAEINVPFAGREVEITWSTGSVKLELARKNSSSRPSIEIPRDIVRDIAARGGIADVTIDRPVQRPTDRVWLDIRE